MLFQLKVIKEMLISKHWSGQPMWVEYLFRVVVTAGLIWAVLGIFGVWS